MPTPWNSTSGYLPWNRWSRRPNGNWLFVFGGIFTIAAVLLLVATISARGEAHRSSRTQDHGARATITVTSVDHIAHHHHSRHGGSHTTYDTIIHGRLDHAINGGTNTAEHEHGYVNASSGERLDVVVDPEDTSYSEPQGIAYETTVGWVVSLVFCIITFAVAIASFAFAFLLRKRRRALAASAPPPPTWQPTSWPPAPQGAGYPPPPTQPPAATQPPPPYSPPPPHQPPPPYQPPTDQPPPQPPAYQPPAPIAQPTWTPTGGPERWQPVPPGQPPTQ